MSVQVVPRPRPSPTNNDAPCLATISVQTQSHTADTTPPKQQVDSFWLLLAMRGAICTTEKPPENTKTDS